MRNTKKLYIFALGALGEGLSGSDRIFIEFARRWGSQFPINIYLWTEGYEMCQKQDLKSENITFKVSSMKPWCDFGFVVNYFARIFEGILLGFTLNLEDNENTLLYSASDFWMDALPCFILKFRYPEVKWAATWYQTAPNPFKGYTGGERKEKYRISALFYWLSQFPIKPLISRFANFVLVNNEEERKQFPKLDKREKAIVVLGAVDLKKIENFKLKNGNLPKVYDAVFQGRFHPQKGVVELIDIWRKVIDAKPDAKLAMIGDGPLMTNVKLKIKNLKLEKNIELFGYVFDGDEKYRIFAQSKIVVHPAFYDSGGMAAAEAMAFGLPCVGFNLKSYASYYPKGMVKVETGNIDKFAESVVKLLNNDGYRNKVADDGLSMLKENWSWDKRANKVINQISH